MANKKQSSNTQGLGLIVFSGDFSRVHYALVMASAAAATNQNVTVFFTMQASCALLEGAPPTSPGWQELVGTKDKSAAQIDQDYGEKGVARFEELFQACHELGVNFMVCEMGLRALDLEKRPLRSDTEILKGGVVSFLAKAAKTQDNQIIFI